MKPKIITLCASVSHYEQLLEIEKELKHLGFTVKMPSSILKMKHTGNFTVTAQKTWFQNPHDYSKKTKLMTDHFKKIKAADAILVVNMEKIRKFIH